jgi:hypothetical protein
MLIKVETMLLIFQGNEKRIQSINHNKRILNNNKISFNIELSADYVQPILTNCII